MTTRRWPLRMVTFHCSQLGVAAGYHQRMAVLRRLGILAAVGSLALSTLLAASPAAAKPGGGVDILAGTSCQIFPTNNIWHADISALPVAKQNKSWLRSIGTSGRLHPDFGPSYGEQELPYGIPITIVPAGTKRVPVRFYYADESDRVRYPLTSKTLIEGGRSADGDRHAIMVTADTCELFETFDTRLRNGKWTAGSGARWKLSSNALRPAGWTSADAAGLPILPGLLRWSEVKAGAVNHAIRFTVARTSAAYLWPARHQAGNGSKATTPPMGARFRLKASFRTAGFSREARTVLRAMKTYGLIVADNGSNWYFQGDADPGWPAELVDELKRIPASAFEAVDASSLRVAGGSGAVR